MKITSWNVNGYRAAYNKGLKSWVDLERPDILCLQEIKARPDQINEDQRLPEYEFAYWNPAQRPGYSGVATFSREKPLEVIYGLGIEKFDIEGRVIQTRFADFTLFNIYFPNGQRGHDRVEFKLEFYAELLKICQDMHLRGEKVIITGDFNTAHMEIDLANPKENVNTSGFMPEERVWVDHFLNAGFVDVYRKRNPDLIQYTWWTYRFGARKRNIGWRIDYFLVSSPLEEKVTDISIHDQFEGSDHCPITLVI